MPSEPLVKPKPYSKSLRDIDLSKVHKPSNVELERMFQAFGQMSNHIYTTPADCGHRECQRKRPRSRPQ